MNNMKYNTIVRMGTIVGVLESEDLYRKGTYNVYCGNNSKRTTCASEISDIISTDYCDTMLFAYQVYNLIK